MLRGRSFYIFLAIYFIYLLFTAYWMPLFESTEARYAEISREMLASGNWMEPYYNGIKHFHKPPFTYWINALGMAIFGVNGFGARFFGAVASILILIYTRKTALALTDDDDTADRSVLILATSTLFIVVSKAVATDIYLVLFSIMSLYYMFNQMYVRKCMSNAIFAGLFLGLGFMTKGPIVFLFTLLPFVTAKFFDRGHRGVFTISQISAGVLVFAAVSLPWYGYVVSINDGLLDYFLKDQTVDRVATNKFKRSKPFYYFFMVFFTMFIPWIFYMFRNYKFTDKLKTGKLAYLYIVMPFIIFQIATSKLGTYILPFFPIASIIASLNIDSKIINRSTGVFLAVAGVAVCAAPFLKDFVAPFKVYLIPFGAFYAILALLYLFKGDFDKRFIQTFTVLIFVLTFAAYCLVPAIGPYVKGYRMLTDDIKAYDPDGKYEVLIYNTNLPVISFYMNDVKAIAFGKARETQFQKPEEYRDILIDTDEQLDTYLNDKKEILLVSRHESYKVFEGKTGYICKDITLKGGDKRVSHCKSPELSN